MSNNNGAFQWNTGGWFGAQIGATCWILVCAAILSMHSLGVAAATLACFLVANTIGFSLWYSRQKIAAYPAIQILLAVCWVASLACVYIIDAANLWPAVGGISLNTVGGQGTVSITAMKLLLFILYPAMMIGFHFKHRQSLT